jgi:hypothetical protein
MQPKADTLIYASTRDGISLPVIDVTHPRFHVPDDAAGRQALEEAFRRSERRNRMIPRFLMRWMLKSAVEKSKLLGVLFGGKESFLDGITTYVMKLGADNLVPPYDAPIDRRFAGSPHATYLRLRTQQMAELMADGLMPYLRAEARPLHIINIAGGPTIDTLNALIILRQRDPALPARPIVINVLDQDDAGPFFGRNALAALQADGQALAGLDIAFDHRLYDWNDVSLLAGLVTVSAGQDAILAASSEGGLFEYGSDQAIIDNLRALAANGKGVRFVVGSVTRDDERRRKLLANSRIKLILRGLEGFSPLAAKAGYVIGDSRPTIWSDQVVLSPVEN